MLTTIWTRPDWTKFRALPDKMHTYINCKLEYREPTEEEIKELWIGTFVSIFVPTKLILGSPEIKQKLSDIQLLYSDIRRMTYDWVTELSNIFIDFLKDFLPLEEYEQLKAIWVTFSPAEEVEALYHQKSNEETTPEHTTTDSVAPTESNSDAVVTPTDTGADSAENTTEPTEAVGTP